MRLRIEDIEIGKCVGEAYESDWTEHLWLHDEYRVRHCIKTPMSGGSAFINQRLREVCGAQFGCVTNKFVYIVDVVDVSEGGTTFTAMWTYDDLYFGVISVEVTPR